MRSPSVSAMLSVSGTVTCAFGVTTICRPPAGEFSSVGVGEAPSTKVACPSPATPVVSTCRCAATLSPTVISTGTEAPSAGHGTANLSVPPVTPLVPAVRVVCGVMVFQCRLTPVGAIAGAEGLTPIVVSPLAASARPAPSRLMTLTTAELPCSIVRTAGWNTKSMLSPCACALTTNSTCPAAPGLKPGGASALTMNLSVPRASDGVSETVAVAVVPPVGMEMNGGKRYTDGSARSREIMPVKSGESVIATPPVGAADASCSVSVCVVPEMS